MLSTHCTSCHSSVLSIVLYCSLSVCPASYLLYSTVPYLLFSVLLAPYPLYLSPLFSVLPAILYCLYYPSSISPTVTYLLYSVLLTILFHPSSVLRTISYLPFSVSPLYYPLSSSVLLVSSPLCLTLSLAYYTLYFTVLSASL